MITFADEHTKHTTTARKRTDGLSRVSIDAGREKLLQPFVCLVEDTDSRVACARKFTGGGQDSFENRLQIEVRNERAPDAEQSSQALFVSSGRSVHLRPIPSAAPGLEEVIF